MNCSLSIRTEYGSSVYYVSIKEELFAGALDWYTIKAMQIMLDVDYLKIGDYVNLKVFIEKVKEKKAKPCILTIHFLKKINDSAERPNNQDFYLAYNALEYLYALSDNVGNYPLDIFAIKFE